MRTFATIPRIAGYRDARSPDSAGKPTFDHPLLFHRGANGRNHPLQVNFPSNRLRFSSSSLNPQWSVVSDQWPVLPNFDLAQSAAFGTRLGTRYSTKSCIDLPRIAARSRGSSTRSAAKVALITLCDWWCQSTWSAHSEFPPNHHCPHRASAITPVPSGAASTTLCPP